MMATRVRQRGGRCDNAWCVDATIYLLFFPPEEEMTPAGSDKTLRPGRDETNWEGGDFVYAVWSIWVTLINGMRPPQSPPLLGAVDGW